MRETRGVGGTCKKKTARRRPIKATEPLACWSDLPEAEPELDALFKDQLDNLNLMLDASVDCIKVIECSGTLRHINQSGRRALGLKDGQSCIGVKWLPLLPAEIRARGRKALHSARRGKKARFAGKSQLPGDKPYYWDNILTPVFDLDGSVSVILCVSRDVTRQREAENKLRVASEIDPLTGLPNRRAFQRQLRTALGRQKGSGRSCGNVATPGIGLLMVDLDYFKQINDTLGHAAGDHLLRVLAKRLNRLKRDDECVARLGGDEFAILVPDVVDEATLTEAATRLLQATIKPVTYMHHPINTRMSIGGAHTLDGTSDAVALMKNSDTALYDIKAMGRGGFQLFNHQMTARAQGAATEMQLARTIINRQSIIPVYQPQLDLLTGDILSYEVLLRWSNGKPNGATTLNPPGAIAEAFRDYFLAKEIAGIVRGHVFRDLARWIAAGVPVVPIAINASPVEFLRDDFAETLLEQIDAHRLPHSLIAIEVTEQVLSERGSSYVLRALRMFKDAGIHISLDDFGTGYSSFARLMEYPIDALKIDQGFVKRMVGDPSIHAIVDTIISLGPRLSLDVVAEGVETREQYDLLTAMGCRIGQGFYLCRPQRADAIPGMQRTLPLQIPAEYRHEAADLRIPTRLG